MEFNEFIEIAKVRQSVRDYDKDREVEDDKIISCLEAMKLSPSACNAQPYFYHIVKGNKANSLAKYLTLGTMNSFAKDVNTFAVVTEENYNLTAKIGSSVKDQDFKSVDIGISVAYFTAQATTLGLSTCILGWFDEPKVKDLLGIKSRVRLVIAIGYAKNDKLREKRRKSSDAIFEIVK